MTEEEIDAEKAQKLLDRYSISPAGNALGGLLSTKIDETLNMNQLFCCCSELPTINDFLVLMSRQMGYDTNKAIEIAIKDYIVNYSTICMRSIGTAVLTIPVPIAVPPTPAIPDLPIPYITVDNDYGLDINGVLSFTDNNVINNLFTVFSMSRLLGIEIEDPDETEEEKISGVDELFNDIVSWLSCNNAPGFPTTVVQLTGDSFHREIMTSTTGTVYFNATKDEVSAILVKVRERLFKLNTDNMAYIRTKNAAMPSYFQLVWGIIATGLVEYMSINYVFAINAGFGIRGLSLYTYTGTAPYTCDGNENVSKVVFGDMYVQRVNVVVEFKIPLPPPLQLPDPLRYLKISEQIRIPNPKFSFTGKDVNGKEKRFHININFPSIDFNFWEGIEGFQAQVTKVALELYANIEKVLINVGYIIDKIEEVLLGVYNKLMEMVNQIMAGMVVVFERVFAQFTFMYMSILIRVQRKLQWDLLASTTPAFAGLNKSLETVVLIANQVKYVAMQAKLFTQKVIDAAKFNEISKFINDKISQINAVKDKMISKAKELIDFGIVQIQIGIDKLNKALQKLVNGIIEKLTSMMSALIANMKAKTKALTDSMIEGARTARDRVEIKARLRLKLLHGYKDGPELDDKIEKAMRQLDISGVFIDITRRTIEKANQIRKDLSDNLIDLERNVIKSVKKKFDTVKFNRLATKVLNIRKNFIVPFLECPIPVYMTTIYDTITEDLVQTGIDEISDTIIKDIDVEVIDSITTEVIIVDKIIDETIDELVIVVVDIVVTDKVVVCVGECDCACGEISTIINTFNYKMEFPL